MELQTLKNKAAEAFAKGKFSRAAELYDEYCKKDPRDLQARIRMGDAWARTGKREKAIGAYQSAAEGFARNGFFPRAIAASKLILELDPLHKGIQLMLADLYAQKGGLSTGLGTGPSMELGTGPSTALGRGPGTESGTGPATGLGTAPSMEPGAKLPPGTSARSSGSRTTVILSARTQVLPDGHGPTFASGGRGALELPSVDSSDRAASSPKATPSASLGKLPIQKNEPAAGSAADVAVEIDLDSPPEAFTELELDGDSLLHAVERAARLGAAARAKASDPRALAAYAALAAAPVDRRETLPVVPLFSDLSPEAFIELFERGPLLRFKKGQRVFEQGSVGQSFFIVCQGSVRVVREENETAKELAVLPEGSFFGEMALLSDNPRIASVEAASDETQVLEISAALLSELSKMHPPVADALRKFCRQRLLLNVMKSSALFRPFDGNDRRALIERFRAREVSGSTTIIREGEHSDGLYVILSGETQVAKEGRVIALLREGDVFGEMSLLDKAPATATVSSTRRTSLLRLPREDFGELIMSHPQILVLVSELTDDRRRQTDAILSGTAGAADDALILV